MNVFNLAVEEINKPLIGADRLWSLYQGRTTTLACGNELSTVTQSATLSNHVDGYIPFLRGCLGTTCLLSFSLLPPQHPINLRSVGLARKPPPNGILLLLNRRPSRVGFQGAFCLSFTLLLFFINETWWGGGCSGRSLSVHYNNPLRLHLVRWLFTAWRY